MIFNDGLMYNFALFIFTVSCDCCVALLHNAKVFFSAVCDCGIS